MKKLQKVARMGFSRKAPFDQTPPDDFDPEHPRKDPVAFFEQRDYQVREKFVEIEAAKELRRKLKKCYQKEGVNHLQNCRDLRLRYIEAIKAGSWGNR